MYVYKHKYLEGLTTYPFSKTIAGVSFLWPMSFLTMDFTVLVTRFTVLGAQILSCEASLKYNPKAVDFPYSVHSNIAATGIPGFQITTVECS